MQRDTDRAALLIFSSWEMRKVLLGFLGLVLVVMFVRTEPPLQLYGSEFTRGELAYISEVMWASERYDVFSDYLTIHLAVMDEGVGHPNWEQGVELCLVWWQALGGHVRALDPPDKFRSFHARLEELSFQYDQCAGLFREGCGLNDQEFSYPEVWVAAEKLKEIKELWLELDSDFPYRLPYRSAQPGGFKGREKIYERSV